MRLSKSEKNEILQKSKGRCAHCGKKIRVGESFSVDHVIPISQVGSNDLSNLVGLCIDCNKEKEYKIVDIDDYFKFVTPSVGKTLKESFRQYCDVYEFLTEKNVFNRDLFSINVPFAPSFRKGGKVARKRVNIIKARYSDLDEIWEYVVGYYKMFSDYLDDRIIQGRDYGECVKEEMISWFSTGAIYFTRGASGKINCVIPSCIREFAFSEDDDYDSNKHLFRYYHCVGPVLISPSITLRNWNEVNYFCCITRFFLDNLVRCLNFPAMLEVLVDACNKFDYRLVKVLEVIFGAREEGAGEQFREDLERGFYSVLITNREAQACLSDNTKIPTGIQPISFEQLCEKDPRIKEIINSTTEYLEKCMLSVKDEDVII